MTTRTARRTLAVLVSLLLVTSAAGSTVALVGTSGQDDAGPAAAAALDVDPSAVVVRANAGGGTVGASSGPDWSGNWQQYHSGSSSTFSTDDSITLDSSVPSGTPTSLFQSEVYGDQQWSFSDGIQSGQEYEVRLYFAEVFQTASSERVFDVAVEGQQVMNDYDIYGEVGHDVGVMKSFTVTPSDGSIDVSLTTEVDNAKLSAIEIVESEPQPDTLGGPSSVDFGSVLVDDSESETVTVTNLGDDGDADITIDDVSVSGDSAFSAGSASQTTLAPGESADIPVTFDPSDPQPMSGTLEVAHSGSNSPLTVSLTGEGTSTTEVGFSKSTLQGFSAGNPTAIDFGPDDRAYVSTQGGTVYALEVERTGENSYEVVHEEQIDAIEDIPNHDDLGNLEAGQDNRQITGLTVGGTADQPVVYVSSSDPEISVGQDDDSTDTNSGAISRLTFDWNEDGSLAGVEHDVMVLGLPRSEENHATNGLELTDDGNTLYVAQGGHTNKGAPGDNFGHTPEYALSAAVLEIDLAQIEANHEPTSLQTHDSEYPDLDYLYSIPTVQGGDLPFGGDDGLNQAKIVEGGPVQVYSPGYRNPYDLVLTEDEQLYVADHGPNGGWGGVPVDEGASGVCTNHPNEDGSFTTGDQLHYVPEEGYYAGHANPIRANPDDAGLYDADGNQYHDFDAGDTPVPFDMANPVECDYQPPAEDGSIGPTFSPTGAIDEYTASNFGGAMEGDLLLVELGGDVERIQLTADGTNVDEVDTIFNTGGPLGLDALGDDEPYPGTVWTANHGGNDVTVFEPNDYGDAPGGDECTGADDPSLDEDGDGYDNADEIDAGSDPCSAASTPADFDDDGTSNVNDPDDDNDGIDDTEDLFAIDPDNGLENDLPATYSFAPNSHSGTILDLGFTGVMMNGQNYQDLYDPSEVTAGGAANVLTVESVGQGDAHAGTNTQAHAYQVGVNADEPFTVETTVNGLPSDAEEFQSQGVFIGTGDQDNYLKLTAAGWNPDGDSGVQLAQEESGTFDEVAFPSAPTAGNETTLSMTVYPSNGTVEAYYAVNGGEEQLVGETTVPTEWFDTADGNGTAVGVIATSNGASSTFDATWQYLDIEPLQDTGTTVNADAGADQTVDEGTEVTLDATGSTGDDLSYSWSQVGDGPSVTLSGADTATPTFTAPDVDADETLTFEVTVADGSATDTDEVTVTVQATDGADQPTDGEVVYRVNAGGSEVAATDDGPAWSTDTDGTPSQYVNADGDNGLNTYSTDDTITLDDSVPSSTPASVFQTERYDVDTDGSTADDTEMQWSFPAESGETYEVRLYFAEIFLDSSNVDAQGPRAFDVVVEGDTKLDDYNLYQQHGHDVGVVESFEVTPSDDAIDVEFLHEQENPKISAIEIVAVGDDTGGDMTVAESVAMGGENDSLIENAEIQQAINMWSTGSEVPDTGGETIGDSQIQSLINTWATDATVGDGTGDDGDQQSGSASVEITPDSGTEASTYVGGSFTIENTGDQEISSVTFDLSSSAMPDVVFDPDGTAGDQAAKGLVIDSESGDGVGVVSTADGDVFSQPHNGVNASDGYDVLTIEFTDFEPGESVSFSADNDPTSIKDASLASQEAGPVSGLELARSTVSVEYDDGSVQETQLFGDGSAGGAQATLDASVASAPSIDVQNVDLDDGALRDHHSAATVSEADQTVTVTGEPGETVTLLHFEAELELSNVPEYDGTPGYDIEAYEANKIEQVNYETVTLDSNGEAEVPVTLLDTTDVGGYNYLVATQGEPGSDTGLASNVVVLEYDESAGDSTGSALVEITPDSSSVDTSTYGGGTYQVTNTGEKNIASVSFDLSTAAFPDMVFDPQGTAGDPTGEGLNIVDEGDTGITTAEGGSEAFSQPHNGENADDGYDVMTVEFTDFQPGEQATFWADNDPTSIKGATIGSQEAGPVSGLELARSTITVTYEDGTTQTTQLMGDGSAGGATAVVTDDETPAPTIGVQDVSLDSSVLDDYHSGATVAEASQTITVSGQPGETVTLVRVEGELALSNVPDHNGTPGYDVEELEANNAVTVEYYTVTLDSNGEATVPVTLTDAPDDDDEAGFNHFVAAHGEASGDMGLASNAVVLKYDESAGDGDTGGSGDVVFAVNAGGDAYTAADGTEFQADTNFDGGSTFTTGNLGTPSDPEISNTDDDELYHTERYGDFSYDVSLDDGEYEVTLHFAEIYQGVANDGGEGDRLFDVSLEGQQVLDEYDIYAEAGGPHTAITETFTVEVTDGELNVDFSTVADNAKVSAIEVTEAGDGSGGDTGTASADFTVNANSGTDASTYNGGSFEIANTGDQQITSVTYDLSSAAFPDVVFDPEGTAGDAGAKGFTADSGESAVDPSGSFAAPHNGENSEDGYDELVVDFGDFESGETFAFSTDIDPTSIKNADGTGAAGSVSGLELSGATVTVEYADGSTQTTSLFGDGSSGGSQAAATDDVPSAPTLGTQDVSLDGSALDARHSAATVSEAGQTITVSGPAGATVQLLHVEGQLELANQADGYDLEAYEANAAENVDYHTVQLDSNGEATVDVTLTNTSSSGVEGGFNYFLAAVQDDSGDTGATSNVVVLKYDENADDGGSSTAQVLHRVNAGEDATVSATDDGPDWTGVADTSSQYLASVAPTASDNYCGGDAVTAGSTVPNSTPSGVWDCERYGNSTWEFSVDSGQTVEVRLYVGNSFTGASSPGDRQFNVSIEGQQVLTQYDPVADVGHATGTMKSFTVTDDGDGTITITFEQGAVENPEVRAIEILESGDSSQ